MEKKSEIGNRYILWKTEYNSKAYTDQFGISQHGYIVEEEIHAVVTEQKEVKGIWGKDFYTAIKAVSSDGGIFTRHWNGFPDDSMSPNYYWDCREDKRGLWQPTDAVAAYNSYIGPYVTKDGKKAIPMGVFLCPNHGKAIYDRYRCFECFVAANAYADALMGKPWACDSLKEEEE